MTEHHDILVECKHDCVKAISWACKVGATADCLPRALILSWRCTQLVNPDATKGQIGQVVEYGCWPEGFLSSQSVRQP